MKKLMTSTLYLFIIIFLAKAQGEEYFLQMKMNIEILDTAENLRTFQQLANSFERVKTNNDSLLTFLDGLMDDWAIWDFALTTQQIQNAKNLGAENYEGE